MSLAINLIFQVSSSGKCSRNNIAKLKGSCPVEDAAHQKFKDRWQARRTRRFGKIVFRNISNTRISLKKDVSLVVIASTTLRWRSLDGPERKLLTICGSEENPSCRARGSRRDSTRYSLPGSSTRADRSRTKLRM